MKKSVIIKRPLEELIEELPPDAKAELRDFAEFLHKKKAHKPMGKPTFKWEGALADMKDQYTSVELQHKVSEWMSGEEK